jgi:hypothetical protein
MKRKISAIIINICIFTISSHIQAWTVAKRLTWNLKTSAYTSIAVDSNDNIYVVWYQTLINNTEIYLVKSSDAGSTWGTLQRLTWMAGYSNCPDITVDPFDNLHIVWYDNASGENEIYYKSSSDGGTTWSPPTRLTWMAGSSFNPRIRADSKGYIHIVWVDNKPGHNEIYYKRSSDGGTNWTGANRLTWFPTSSLAPSLAIDFSDNLHVVWPHSVSGAIEIYYKKSTDPGINWTISKRLTWVNNNLWKPWIAADSKGNLRLVWHGNPSGNDEIYFRSSTDGGTTWTSPLRITWNSGYSNSPVIIPLSDRSLHIVWGDDFIGNKELYYKQSSDGGTSWYGLTRLTYNSGDSNFPAMAKETNTNSLHVVWQDNTPGALEIYHKKQYYPAPAIKK